MSSIILADHDNRQFGVEAVNVPVVESPDHVLGAIAADSKIEGISRSVVVIPDGFTDPFIPLNNGVADIDEVDIPQAGFGIHRFVSLHPAWLTHGNRDHRRVGRLSKSSS